MPGVLIGLEERITVASWVPRVTRSQGLPDERPGQSRLLPEK